MAAIEDYALIGDARTVALVSREGSIDWWCTPRFDSAACFAALLGQRSHGHWTIAPAGGAGAVDRRYRPDTLVLETTFTTDTGRATLIDFMPRHDLEHPCIVRIVRGVEGTVELDADLVVRFDYGSLVPWVRRTDHGVEARGGADGLVLRSTVATHGRDLTTAARFSVSAGEEQSFSLAWFPSHEDPPAAPDPDESLDATEAWWHEWANVCTDVGPWSEAVRRSLITLKALTYEPTGGIVAAATTSLPEWIGSVRNWDYRFCWLRDATFTLSALIENGYESEALAWSQWLRRAVAGSPDMMQIMYGVAGERRLTEYEIEWLPGYESSAPVRVGNGASEQFQLDVFGEVMDMVLNTAEALEAQLPEDTWALCRVLVGHVADVWRHPDDGIWEVRGPRRHFVHSKVMAWVAVDRWVRLCELERPQEPLERWRALREEIHADVCEHGWNAAVGSFTQYYGSDQLDASLLMVPLVGFLPADDERMVATVEAVERDLLVDGFVLRYRTDVDHPDPGPAPAPVSSSSASASASSPAGPVGRGAVADLRRHRVRPTGFASTVSRAAPKGEQTGDGTHATVDGLPPGEGAFLLTTFWLVDCLVLLGRVDEAQEIFERLLALRNDVGLLSEEYDPAAGRMLGNFPQAFSHVGLVNTAANLAKGLAGPAGHRATTPARRRHRTRH
jgi:GH15 family glucan-1,4-alpha-glucosidase